MNIFSYTQNDFVDVIKLMTLRWRFPHIISGPNLITWLLKIKESFLGYGQRETWLEKKSEKGYATGYEDGKGGHKPRNVGGL